jgi:hypothetical protein
VVFRVFRQGDRPSFERVKVAVRTGAAYVLPAGGQLLSSEVVEVPERLSIAQGQWPGLNLEWPLQLAGKAAAGNRIRFMQPAPADEQVGQSTLGSASEASAATLDGVVLSFNALLEPDADHDGYGDETQDCAPADPAVQTGCSQPSQPLPPAPDLLPVGINCNGSCPTTGQGGAIGPPGTQTYIVFGWTPPVPSGNGRGYVVAVACPPGSSVNCTGTVDLTLNGGRARAAARAARLLGRARFSVTPGSRTAVKVAFSKAGLKLLGKRRRQSITVTLRPSGGPAVSVRRTVTLPRPH